MPALDDILTDIFLDTADLDTIRIHVHNHWVKGFTTNPTLMRKAGVVNYADYAARVLFETGQKPVSFEVIADDLATMEAQARIIAGWGPNVVVKIPIMTSTAEPTLPVIAALLQDGICVNVTAVMTMAQVRELIPIMKYARRAYISIFAGRIADCGLDASVVVELAVNLLRGLAPGIKVIWASPRQVHNVVEANHVGCHIITLMPELIAKLPMLGRDPRDVSRETCAMFYRDAVASGLTL